VYDREQQHAHWAFRKPRRREEFPVGVMGLGVLGQRVAQAVRSFDYPVNGWSRTPKHVDGIECFAGEENFDAFLAASRALVCLLPLTPETEGIMNRTTLAKLMPGGYVVNVARGAHLVEEDLIPLLDSGQLAGAALDVQEVEPPDLSQPPYNDPRVIVTPHAAFVSEESLQNLRSRVATQVATRLTGGVPDNIVNGVKVG